LKARSRKRILLLLTLAVASVSAQAGCDLSGITLPVTMAGLRPLVPVKIEDTPLFMLLDSGAFYSVLSPASAARLHLRLQSAKLQLGGVTGNEAASITSVQHLTLANSNVPETTFLVGGSDLGGGAAGLLGQSILRQSDVEYDLGNGLVRLIHPDDCGHAPLAYWARGVPYSTIEFAPDTLLFFGYRTWRLGVGRLDPYVAGAVADAYLNGVKIRVLFDTGSSNSILTLRAAARAGVKPDSPGVVPAGNEFGIGQSVVSAWIGPFESFRIGGEQTLHTHLRFGDVQLSGHADMVLGADFFLSHRIYVANSQRKIYFTYNGGPVFDLKSDSALAAQPRVDGAEPADAGGFDRRGAALAARHLFERAIADFTRASELQPMEPLYFYERGLAYRDDNRPDLALADFDRALRLKPDYLGPRLARAEMHLKTGDKAAAAADLENAAQVASAQSELRLEIASDDVEADRFGAAIAQYDLWTASHPNDNRIALALNGRCWARALAGVDLAKAEGDCNHALHLNPRSSAVLSSRGVVRLREGKYAKALNDFDAALQQEPKEAWPLYGRAVDELRLGRTAAGQADLAAASAADPAIAERAGRYGITP
jgi:tetratricopeptide (TPR) repeat protein